MFGDDQTNDVGFYDAAYAAQAVYEGHADATKVLRDFQVVDFVSCVDRALGCQRKDEAGHSQPDVATHVPG